MAQTPTAMTCSLYPVRTHFNLGEEIELIGEGSAYTGTGSRADVTYNFYVHYHASGTTQAPATDPIIEGPTEKDSDKWGKASVYADPGTWRTGTSNLYYGRVVYTTVGATPTEISGTTTDFRLRSTLEAMSDDLAGMLGDLQRQPLLNLISADTGGGTTYRFGLGGFAYRQMGPWFSDPAPIFKRLQNDNTVDSLTPASVDYDNWTITTSSALSEGDEVELEFALFQYFTDADLERFIELAIDAINGFGIPTVYTLGDLPQRLGTTAIMGARMFALYDLLMGMLFQNKLLIFGDPQVRALLQTEYANTSTFFLQTMLPQSKKRGIVTPALVTSHEAYTPIRIVGSTWRNLAYSRGAIS